MRVYKFIVVFLVIVALCGCAKKIVPDEVRELQGKVESALPTEYQKQYEVEVIQYTFREPKGSEIQLYLCLTTYFEAEPEEPIGLHTEAFEAVFSVEDAVLIKEFDASGHAAAIYQTEACNYICYTTNAAASGVISYDPNLVSEDDMVHAVLSVYDSSFA